ncbi:VWA domain-containing protein [Microbulbifer sp. 2304DJ12-6]|uniref:VWA domain-containing protein n=1 Tax=Microbulbifer sp. 2304DJ12-6 TaxID=3233340 RepID=UPI0039B0980A
MIGSRKKKRQEEFSISFLDVICCGFGAIVLLLMIAKTAEPIVLEETEVDLEAQVIELQQQLMEIRGETTILNRDLNAKREQIDIERKRIANLRGELEALQAVYASKTEGQHEEGRLKGELTIALQTMTDEMRRLLGENYQRKNNVIGGIPVDSEYILFIVDTSGSMFNYGWERMMDEMVNTLDLYPEVKGIQVMNDMGDYMFFNYRNKWIPDTPGRRQAILKRLKTWNPFSNSSPVEGIQKAVRSFYDPSKKISIYVLGDEFTGKSIRNVMLAVERVNARHGEDKRNIRIHAVGFPIQFSRPPHLQTTGLRFAALMRELTYRNGGTFVGLNDFR